MDAVHVRFGTPSTFSRFGRSIDCNTAFGFYKNGTPFVQDGEQLLNTGDLCVSGKHSFLRYSQGQFPGIEANFLAETFDDVIMAMFDYILVSYWGDDYSVGKIPKLCVTREARAVIKNYLARIGTAIVENTNKVDWDVREGLQKTLGDYTYIGKTPHTNYFKYFYNWETILPTYFNNEFWNEFQDKSGEVAKLEDILEDILFMMCNDICSLITEEKKKQPGQSPHVGLWISEHDVEQGVYHSQISNGLINRLVFATSGEDERILAEMSRN